MSRLTDAFRRQAERTTGTAQTTALHLAIKAKDAQAVRELMAEGGDVYATDGLGRTPLILATEQKSRDILELILQYDRHGIDHAGPAGTALCVAAAAGDGEAANILLRHGAHIDAGDGDGGTPLFHAFFNRQKDMLAFLLERGADPAKARANNETLLHLAAQADDVQTLARLLAHGGARAVQERTETFKLTPLHQAVRAGALKAARLLIAAGADANIADSQAMTPLHTAAARNDTAMIRLLAEEGHADVNKTGNPAGYTALHTAVIEKKPEAFDALVRCGGDPHQPDGEGRTPLNIAGWNGCLPILRYIMETLPPEPDAGAAAQSRLQALYDALFYEHKDAAACLLDSGMVDLNRPTRGGDYALQAALQSRQLEMAEAMLRAKADPNRRNRNGNAPLFQAAARNDLAAASLLLAYGADPNLPAAVASPSRNGETPLQSCGETPLQSCGETPLHAAAAAGHAEMAALLIAHGANPAARDPYQRTALDLARTKGKTNLVPLLAHALENYGNQNSGRKIVKRFQGPALG